MTVKNLLQVGALCAAATMTVQTHAAEILFAYVGDGVYHVDGENIASKLSAMGGYTVTQVNLYEQILNDISGYDQVWVYDLSATADNNTYQSANYSILADWYNTRSASTQNLIADGRIISSSDRWIGMASASGLPSETGWIQNYALQLDALGGGLVLGTDHNVFADGINTINSLIGIDDFTGYYYSQPLQAVVDDESPFYLSSLGNCQEDATQKCINDNSSTSFVPTGLQANGQFLTPVAWHGNDAFGLAAVSSTIGSPTFGTEVPEPSTLLLTLMGLLGIHFSRKRAK